MTLDLAVVVVVLAVLAWRARAATPSPPGGIGTVTPPDDPGDDDPPAGAFDVPDPTAAPGVSPGVQALAQAISVAEGFPVKGSIPERANNPGDLVRGDVGYGVLGSEKITRYGTLAEGWRALYHQLQIIENGTSHNYTTDMTLREMAHKWTATEPDAWAANVARALTGSGQLTATPDTTLDEVFSL